MLIYGHEELAGEQKSTVIRLYLMLQQEFHNSEQLSRSRYEMLQALQSEIAELKANAKLAHTRERYLQGCSSDFLLALALDHIKEQDAALKRLRLYTGGTDDSQL